MAVRCAPSRGAVGGAEQERAGGGVVGGLQAGRDQERILSDCPIGAEELRGDAVGLDGLPVAEGQPWAGPLTVDGEVGQLSAGVFEPAERGAGGVRVAKLVAIAGSADLAGFVRERNPAVEEGFGVRRLEGQVSVGDAAVSGQVEGFAKGGEVSRLLA